MKERILKIVCLVLGALFQGTPQAQASNSSDSFRIGFIYSKTGRLSPYSKSVSQGAKLALQMFRAEHPNLASKVQMIAADDESSIAGANKAATRLLGRQSVHVLIGSFANVINLPLLALCKHYQTPMLMPRATDESLVGQNIAFSITPDDQRQGRMIAQFILRHLKLNQVALIVEANKPDAASILEGFQRVWGDEGGQVMGLWEFKPGVSHLGAMFQDISAKKPPAIVFLGSVSHASLLLDRASQNALNAPWIGSDAWDDERIAELPANLPTPYFFSYFHKLDPSPLTQSFAQAYYEAYNSFPDALAAEGYASTHIALAAYLQQQQGDSSLLKILESETFQSLQGTARFSRDNILLQAQPFLRVMNGKYKVVNRVLLQD